MKQINRLKEYIDFKGISLHSFDISIGASNGYIGKQIKNSGTIGGETIEKIISYYTDLNPIWLLTGSGSMIKNYDNNVNKVSETNSNYNSKPHNSCELCAEKEKLIESLQYTIKTQQDFIECLKQQSPYDEGQKRKAG